MECGQRIDYLIGLIQKDLEGEQFLIQSYKHSLMAGHTDTATHAKQALATNSPIHWYLRIVGSFWVGAVVDRFPTSLACGSGMGTPTRAVEVL